jgi:serine/threonine protein kinase
MNNQEYLNVSNNDIYKDYIVLKSIGKGAFSQVYKVHNKNDNNEYALKIGRISNRFQKSYQNEIKLLEQLNKNPNPNIIKMFDNFKLNNRYFLVFEICGKNLYSFLGRNNYNGLEIKLVRDFTQQIINGLKLLNKLKIIHGDLKPENILVSPDSKNIKIIDFGSSFIEKKGKYFNYIQTRYYRSPEVLLGLEITTAIDLWSLGCIIYEMIRGYPLFKAKNYQDLFLYQVHMLGIPNRNLIQKSQYGTNYFTNITNNYYLRKTTDSRKLSFEPKTREIERHVNDENKDLFNIIFECIKWIPNERLDLNKK